MRTSPDQLCLGRVQSPNSRSTSPSCDLFDYMAFRSGAILNVLGLINMQTNGNICWIEFHCGILLFRLASSLLYLSLSGANGSFWGRGDPGRRRGAPSSCSTLWPQILSEFYLTLTSWPQSGSMKLLRPQIPAAEASCDPLLPPPSSTQPPPPFSTQPPHPFSTQLSAFGEMGKTFTKTDLIFKCSWWEAERKWFSVRTWSWFFTIKRVFKV